MTTEQAIKYIKLDEGRRVTAEESISILERMLDEFYNEDSYAPECKDAVDMAIEALTIVNSPRLILANLKM